MNWAIVISSTSASRPKLIDLGELGDFLLLLSSQDELDPAQSLRLSGDRQDTINDSLKLSGDHGDV